MGMFSALKRVRRVMDGRDAGLAARQAAAPGLRAWAHSASVCGCLALLLFPVRFPAAPLLPTVAEVDWPLFAGHVTGLVEATDALGGPLRPQTKRQLARALKMSDRAAAKVRIQELLDPYCLLGVQIDPGMGVTVVRGPAKPVLTEGGWRMFLVKVANQSGTRAVLRVVSAHARSVFESGYARTESDEHFRPRGGADQDVVVADRWLDLATYGEQPLGRGLTGLEVEYRIVETYSSAPGRRKARLVLSVGTGVPGKDSRNEIGLRFRSVPAQEVTLSVRDEKDQPTTAAFLIRDRQGRIYPPLAKRQAPDFPFQLQVYRADGEVLRLAAGIYSVECSRGPESISQTREITVREGSQTETFRVERWIDTAQHGWWSGDHHLHAAGCAHSVKPTEGVGAGELLRHLEGEDLKVGSLLIWGPGFDSEAPCFSGAVDPVSRYPYLLRWDLEVAGFGSHESGHLALLGLRDRVYPGSDAKEGWPKLGLNTLRWAKQQGAVAGPTHSGLGLEVKTNALPNDLIPSFNGVGANEYIVDVTHEVPGPDGALVPAVDFLSTMATPYVWELNIWYHTLNVGFRTRIAGETAFPCLTGERVGMGRSYVQVEGNLDYGQWCEGLRAGRCYVSDGKSHLLDFQVNEVSLGKEGSELRLDRARVVRVKARVAARLPEKPEAALRDRPLYHPPYWGIERARLEESRAVLLEVIVNGKAVAEKRLVADGTMQEVPFEVAIDRSSWVALRILPSSHTNPIFVLVDGKPVRASKGSADWCLKSVDQCWSEKETFLKGSLMENELDEARAAYDHARKVYRARLEECTAD